MTKVTVTFKPNAGRKFKIELAKSFIEEKDVTPYINKIIDMAWKYKYELSCTSSNNGRIFSILDIEGDTSQLKIVAEQEQYWSDNDKEACAAKATFASIEGTFESVVGAYMTSVFD